MRGVENETLWEQQSGDAIYCDVMIECYVRQMKVVAAKEGHVK